MLGNIFEEGWKQKNTFKIWWIFYLHTKSVYIILLPGHTETKNTNWKKHVCFKERKPSKFDIFNFFLASLWHIWRFTYIRCNIQGIICILALMGLINKLWLKKKKKKRHAKTNQLFYILFKVTKGKHILRLLWVLLLLKFHFCSC